VLCEGDEFREEIWFDKDFWQIIKDKLDIFECFLVNGTLNGEDEEEIEGKLKIPQLEIWFNPLKSYRTLEISKETCISPYLFERLS